MKKRIPVWRKGQQLEPLNPAHFKAKLKRMAKPPVENKLLLEQAVMLRREDVLRCAITWNTVIGLDFITAGRRLGVAVDDYVRARAALRRANKKDRP